MEATIKVKVSELNASLLERIKVLFQGKEDSELTISFDDSEGQYYEILDRSKRDLEQENGLVHFTIDQLEDYSNRKRA